MRHLLPSSVVAVAVIAAACTPAVTPAPVASGPSATSTSAVAPPPPRHVTILISIDALRPVDLDDPSIQLPSLRALIARGARAKSAISVWPSVTYPAHATMVTGVAPREHGIVANGPLDPDLTNDGGWFWYAEDIHAKTLWQAAKENGLRTANVYWPTTVGAVFDWSFPQYWRAKVDEDDKLLRALATPHGLGDELRAAQRALPTEHRDDVARTDGAVFLLEKKHPDFLLLYLTDLDTVRHKRGPESDEAKATLAIIDRQIGRVVAATHDDDLRHTTIVVVSDHGFRPVSQFVRPLAYLASQGFVTFDERSGRVAHRAVAVSCSGGMADVVVTDATQLDAVKRAVDELAVDPKYGIEHVYSASEMASHGGGFPSAQWTLEAKSGFMFDCAAGGDVVGATSYKGTHGWPPELPEMRAVFLSAGAGVARGKTIPDVSLLDVAPTVARILGIPWALGPGHVLDAIFE